MKIGIVSDLHLRHWAKYNYLPVQWVLESLEKERPDILLDAGDLELPGEFRTSVDTVTVLGNHDYYDKTWHGNPVQDCHVNYVSGLKIVSTTLWSDFNNNDPFTHLQVGRFLNDFRVIDNFTTKDCYEAHLIQRDWLHKQFPCDIVVTHHSPSFKSVALKYQHSGLMNFGFSSELDWLVEESEAKIWVHGHTHEQFDYYLGDTRVICSPCGYPGENGVGRDWEYKPVYIEL